MFTIIDAQSNRINTVVLACWQKFRLKVKVGSSQLPELDPDDLRYVRLLSLSFSLSYLPVDCFLGGWVVVKTYDSQVGSSRWLRVSREGRASELARATVSSPKT